MPQHSERFALELPLEQVHAACQQAIAAIGWRVFKQEEKLFVFKEVSSATTASTWPVEIQVRLTSVTQGTGVEVFGSNFGFGPIQKNHVRGQIGNFINRLQVCVQQQQAQHSTVAQAQATSGTTLVAELEKLARLHQTGALTDTEFSSAKQSLLNSSV